MHERSDVRIGFEVRHGDAVRVLAEHGKSFHWASFLLDKNARNDAAVLYYFCRSIDDAVDKAQSTKDALREIDCIRAELAGIQRERKIIAQFSGLAQQYAISEELPSALITGVSEDIGSVRIQTTSELLQYCYRVAGTVGEMMIPILGVRDGRARPHAVDLGIAMQLTNIARDVLEDAHRDRIYLPAEWLPSKVSCKALVNGAEAERAAITSALLRLLSLAERYYSSADQGLRFIPLRNRIGILVASRIYRAIGQKIALAPESIWTGRTVVSTKEKAVRSLSAILEILSSASILNIGQITAHDSRLHEDLWGQALK